jgi:hypothetical protein
MPAITTVRQLPVFQADEVDWRYLNVDTDIERAMSDRLARPSSTLTGGGISQLSRTLAG